MTALRDPAGERQEPVCSRRTQLPGPRPVEFIQIRIFLREGISERKERGLRRPGIPAQAG